MIRSLYRPDQVKEVLAAGAQLVEVLPKREFEELHLPEALSIPLRKLESLAPQMLDRDRAVVVYCWDTACDLSPRAAARLERLGFADVYDYVPGKADWLEHGLPTEGSKADDPTAGRIARRDVPTCGLTDRVSDVDSAFCVVIDERSVVHGMVRRADLEPGDARTAEEAMRPGPSTFRPNVPVDELADFMTKNDLTLAPITTSEGVLIGVVERDHAQRVASETHSH